MAGRPKNQGRESAISNGGLYYIGKACKHSHAGLRYVSTRACVECMGGSSEGATIGLKAVILELV